MPDRRYERTDFECAALRSLYASLMGGGGKPIDTQSLMRCVAQPAVAGTLSARPIPALQRAARRAVRCEYVRALTIGGIVFDGKDSTYF